MRIITLMFLIALAYTAARSQDVAAVGDEVDYKCNCFGQVWVKATVESIRGNSLRVRFGNLDNQVATVTMDSGLIRLRPKPEDPRVVELRKSFLDQVSPKYHTTVGQFAQYYDKQFLPAGGPARPDEWRKAMADLAELDTLCKGQYRGVTDFPGDYVRPGYIEYRFSTWCQIAAARTELEPRARAGMAKTRVNLGYTEENLNFGFNEPQNPLRTETQQLIWDRPNWRVEKTAWLKPKYAEYGASVPPDAFDAVEKRADELRAMVERDAPTRSWTQPPHHDPAVESFMKAKFVAEYPGASVLKIGLDYNTWVQRKSLTYVGSDDTFRYYNVSYNSYKRGWVLLKVPNRPFCQAQEWVVGRGGKGMVAVAVGGSGIFMKCE